ncbi:MAG: hypothetical protein Q9167_006658 [Letrouitia subvulpina]
MTSAPEVGEDNNLPNAFVRPKKPDDGKTPQRLLRVDQIYSRKDRQVHFVKTAKATSKPDRHGKTALVVRRVINEQGILTTTEIDIKSSHLQDIFSDIFADVPDLELSKTPPIASPKLFFHARPHLMEREAKEKEKSHPDQKLIDDIRTAIRFVEEDYGDMTTNVESLLANGQITWDQLWAIFPPKTSCLAPNYGLLQQTQAFYFEKSSYSSRDDHSRFFNIRGKVITHDGSNFGWGHISIEIDQFEGARQLTSLNAYPLANSIDYNVLREKLIARGRRYVGMLARPKCFEYAGGYSSLVAAIREEVVGMGKLNATKFNVRDAFHVLEDVDQAAGRVVVDPKAFAIHNPFLSLSEPGVNAKDVIVGRALDESQLLVCAHWINGFSFGSKTWGQLMMENLTDIVWNEEAFTKLVMKEERRNLIHQLVRSHRLDKETFDDIIPNKGQGLVFLLAGPPGVGKTLTAEAVAETTRRPLYVVSVGELGSDAGYIDRKLKSIFDISRSWGCVLLIDEADVFLSVRGQNPASDILVGIFLRRMETYGGILVLTTNRQNNIDKAFQSRIHFTIEYTDLDQEGRAAVWKNLIGSTRLNHESINDQGIAKLSKREMNGRQIKNAVACATSLARDQEKALTVEDIECLLDIL